MKYEHLSEIKGIIILALGLILLASFVSFAPADLSWYTSQPNDPAKNWVRIFGAYTAGSLFFTFGSAAYLIVIFMLFWSWSRLTAKVIRFSAAKLISFSFLLCVASAILSLATFGAPRDRFGNSGVVGAVVSDFLVRYFGVVGAYILLFAVGALALILTGEFLLTPLFIKLSRAINEAVFLALEKIQTLRETVESKAIRPKERQRAKEIKDIVDKTDKRVQAEKDKVEALTKMVRR
jgi:DNA segregation ATPase FtsK/SpoIIIE, S-DNA-T family